MRIRDRFREKKKNIEKGTLVIVTPYTNTKCGCIGVVRECGPCITIDEAQIIDGKVQRVNPAIKIDAKYLSPIVKVSPEDQKFSIEKICEKDIYKKAIAEKLKNIG